MDNLANPSIALRNALPFQLLHCMGVVPYYIGATFGPHRLCHKLRQVGFDVIETTAVMHCPCLFAVAMTRILERYGSVKAQRRLLHCLTTFEYLAHWPTRFLTGYFLAVKAIKR